MISRNTVMVFVLLISVILISGCVTMAEQGGVSRPDNHPDTPIPPQVKVVRSIPLKLYWNSKRTDNFTTATSKGESDARAAGYRFVRIMGYIAQNNRK